jgi:hypothetical protein
LNLLSLQKALYALRANFPRKSTKFRAAVLRTTIFRGFIFRRRETAEPDRKFSVTFDASGKTGEGDTLPQ